LIVLFILWYITVYLQQTYINNSEETIEAIYKFPLSFKAVVESFEADIDGQSLQAKIYKNDEASELYKNSLKVNSFLLIVFIYFLFIYFLIFINFIKNFN